MLDILLHHPKSYAVNTPSSDGYYSHGRFFHCNKLIILQSLRHHPENIWIGKLSQQYLEAIDRYRRHCYSCDDVYGPKGKHKYQPGYNCKTILPFKKRSNVVNHPVGHIQFGDITFIQSSYTDLGKPITEQEKKIAPPFTMSQNQAYVFYKQSPIITDCQLITGNQPLDYLDNMNLGAV
jgi:hypothetical protein